MAVGLGDIYEKLKELITIMDKVRENTDDIKNIKTELVDIKMDIREIKNDISSLKSEQAEIKNDIHVIKDTAFETRSDVKAVLMKLKTEERIESIESILREHIAACEKAKA